VIRGRHAFPKGGSLGTIAITLQRRLAVPKSIIFPSVEPYWVFERECLRFPALVDGTIVNCLVSGEALIQHFGARGMTADEARRAFNDHKLAIQEAARGKIEAGEYNTRGEVLLKMSDFARQTTTTPPPFSERALRVSYPGELESDPILKDLIVNASSILKDELGRALPDVAAEWKLVPVETGETLVKLTVRDLETRAWVENLFTLADLKDEATFRFSLIRLWDDLLQERGRAKIRELAKTAGSGE
jgi:hypothetical protein